jgi:hypothetical protein
MPTTCHPAITSRIEREELKVLNAGQVSPKFVLALLRLLAIMPQVSHCVVLGMFQVSMSQRRHAKQL